MKTKILMFCFPLRHPFDIERLMGWKTAQLIAESNTDIKVITTSNGIEPFQLHHRIDVLKPFENWNFKSIPNIIKLILKFPNYIIHFNWSDDLSTFPLNFLLALKSSLSTNSFQKSIISKWSLTDSITFKKLVKKWSHVLELTYSSENQLAQSLKTYEHIINFFDTSLSNENFNFDIESEIYRTPDKYIFLPITNLKNLQTKKYFHLSQKIIDQKLDIKIVMTIDTSQISHKKYWNLKSVLSELNLLDRVEFISMNTLNFQVLTSRSFLTILDSEILSEVEYHFLKYICIQYNYKFIELNKLDDNNQSFGAFLDKAIITEDLKNHDKISSFNYIDQTTNMFLKIYSQACG